jgi:hypothetical protein
VDTVRREGCREIGIRDGAARAILRRPVRRVLLTAWNANDVDGRALGRRTIGPVPLGDAPIRIRLAEGRTVRGRVVGVDGKRTPLTRVEAFHTRPLFDFDGAWRLSDCLCGWR